MWICMITFPFYTSLDNSLIKIHDPHQKQLRFSQFSQNFAVILRNGKLYTIMRNEKRSDKIQNS